MVQIQKIYFYTSILQFALVHGSFEVLSSLAFDEYKTRALESFQAFGMGCTDADVATAVASVTSQRRPDMYTAAASNPTSCSFSCVGQIDVIAHNLFWRPHVTYNSMDFRYAINKNIF